MDSVEHNLTIIALDLLMDHPEAIRTPYKYRGQ